MNDRFFTFNGRSSKDFNLLIQNDFEIEAGDADVSYTSVPGRNLDIVNPNNRYKNGTITYECFIDIRWFNDSFYKDLSELRRDLVAWLAVEENFSGYSKLQDNLDENYYYLARLSKAPTMSFISSKCANITLEFNVGPVKYRLDSDLYQEISNNNQLYNPEPLSSYPIIKITGTGSLNLKINGISYKITEIHDLTYINCEKRRIYDDKSLKNNIGVFPNYQYPILKTGENNISWDNSNADVSIKFNWRTFI